MYAIYSSYDEDKNPSDDEDDGKEDGGGSSKGGGGGGGQSRRKVGGTIGATGGTDATIKAILEKLISILTQMIALLSNSQ